MIRRKAERKKKPSPVSSSLKKISPNPGRSSEGRKKSSSRSADTLPPCLGAEQTFNACSTSQFKFRNTKDITESHEIFAQARAVRAIDMGLGVRKPGYNIYVAGYHGTGKTSIIRSFLEKWSKNTPIPNDWIYVYDFQKSETPKAVTLPAGEGFRFAKGMEQVVKGLRRDIPDILQSEEYEKAVNSRISQNNDRQSRNFSDLERFAKKMNFQIKSTRLGIETIPIVDGRPLTEKEYGKLSEKERSRIETKRSKLEPQVLDFARKVRGLEIDAREYVQTLQKTLSEQVLSQILAPVYHEFAKYEQIIAYLDQAKDHILENLGDFVEDDGGGAGGDEDGSHHANILDLKDRFRKYRVNLFVDNRTTKGAPVVIESNPSYYNLFGKVEKNVEHGMFYTDLTMVKAGAIHKANGGYLVLEAVDIFKAPAVWETLKRVLRNRQGFIEDMGEQLSLFPTSGIRPEPIPLDIKVILIGTDDIYHYLHELDEEFSKIFKIKADFDYKMARSRENMDAYVSFIATRSHKEGLLHFDRSGVAAVIEYGSRLVDHQAHLTTKFGEIKDLTIEADFIAREQRSKLIRREHVEEALRQKFYRVNLVEHHLLEALKCEDIILTVDGRCVGQVNGLAVYDVGDYSFGKPGRITSNAAISAEGIINIERATKLSGNIHDKGVYILSSFLGALLAREFPLGLSATICFEQSYGVIDGDSATIASLTAIVSAMSGIPVRQNLAMTGSLNQLGEVQAVGGINEKIEGFYRSCRLIGRGRRFDLIFPYQNIDNLMLQEEVREAVSSGYLRLYPVKYFWQAFELATGVRFGAKTVLDDPFQPRSALAAISERLKNIRAAQERHNAKDQPKTNELTGTNANSKRRKNVGGSRTP